MTKAVRFATIREIRTFEVQCSGCDRVQRFEDTDEHGLPEGWTWQYKEFTRGYGTFANEYIWCPDCQDKEP